MKETVLVEFLVKMEDKGILLEKLDVLNSGFTLINAEYEWEHDNDDLVIDQWYRLSGRIDSAYATMIKLQDSFLSDHMRISYIPEDLKNKYRK